MTGVLEGTPFECYLRKQLIQGIRQQREEYKELFEKNPILREKEFYIFYNCGD